MHIRWHKLIEDRFDYNLGGFYMRRRVKRCRCGSIRTRNQGYL